MNDKLGIIIAVFSLIISILNMIYNRRDTVKKRAPILEVNQSYYNGGSKYTFSKIDSQKDDERECIILDRRLFQKNNDEQESHFSLIFDTAIGQSNLEEAIGFDTLVIRNVGYSLSKITIEEICFFKENDCLIKLCDSKRNKLLLNMRKNDEITILLSGRFGKMGYQPLFVDKLNDFDGEYAKKLSKIKDTNLLNTRCISEADNWDNIIVKIRTENLYGEQYIQNINFSISNNTYYMKTSKPKRCMSNIIKRFFH